MVYCLPRYSISKNLGIQTAEINRWICNGSMPAIRCVRNSGHLATLAGGRVRVVLCQRLRPQPRERFGERRHIGFVERFALGFAGRALERRIVIMYGVDCLAERVES